MQRAVQEAVKTFGRLDVVINNAGGDVASVEDVTGGTSARRTASESASDAASA
ncbi:hypothetical protein OG453_38930 [Streptomyces sp. NBC_01381]|uniref:hypothetical protein n=1 Tax=Streptomyces sp. NBC_01381 TaxID=2903845 RepID=UPI00225250D8|nr:hypothetical protein [Streptomyces sp. NBC_01381]MCX4672554.1 hypothetical protein [Streptomyces sp. NBC_01381]